MLGGVAGGLIRREQTLDQYPRHTGSGFPLRTRGRVPYQDGTSGCFCLSRSAHDRAPPPASIRRAIEHDACRSIDQRGGRGSWKQHLFGYDKNESATETTVNNVVNCNVKCFTSTTSIYQSAAIRDIRSNDHSGRQSCTNEVSLMRCISLFGNPCRLGIRPSL